MDLSGLQDLIPDIAGWLNVEPATLLLLLAIIGTTANVTSRLIPDDATGWLGTVRRIATVIGIYVPNRVTNGITVTDVAKAVVANKVEDVKREVVEKASEAPALIPIVAEAIEHETEKVIPAFPGLIGSAKEESNEENSTR